MSYIVLSKATTSSGISETIFLPVLIKKEPVTDDAYGKPGVTVTDLDCVIKTEIKQEELGQQQQPQHHQQQHPQQQQQQPQTQQQREMPSSAGPSAGQATTPARGSSPKPRRTSRKSNNTLVSRSSTSAENRTTGRLFALDEILEMDGRLLVQNFSHASSDRMTRYFAYTCALVPDDCSDFYTSFGSPADARIKMQRHLLQHVNELNDIKREDPTFSFFAEGIENSPVEEETPKARKRGRPTLNKPRDDPSTSAGTGGEPAAIEDVNHNLEVIDLNSVKQEVAAEETETVAVLPAAAAAAAAAASGKPSKPKAKNGYDVDADWEMAVKPKKAKKDKHWQTDSSLNTSDSLERISPERPTRVDHDYQSATASASASRAEGAVDPESRNAQRLLVVFRPQASQVARASLHGHPNQPQYGVAAGNGYHAPLENGRERKQVLVVAPSDAGMEGEEEGEGEGEGEGESGTEGPSIPDATEEEVREIEKLRGHWTKEHEKILAKYYLKEHEMNKGKNRKVEAWQCKICPDKKFTAGTTLTYHYKSHTGEKQFKCEVCGKLFTRKHSLAYHRMTHNKTTRFKCQHCDKQFRHTSHYKNHLLSHTEQDENQCSHCEHTFKSKTTYARHLRLKHNIRTQAPNKVSRVMSLNLINEIHLGKEVQLGSIRGSDRETAGEPAVEPAVDTVPTIKVEPLEDADESVGSSSPGRLVVDIRPEVE